MQILSLDHDIDFDEDTLQKLERKPPEASLRQRSPLLPMQCIPRLLVSYSCAYFDSCAYLDTYSCANVPKTTTGRHERERETASSAPPQFAHNVHQGSLERDLLSLEGSLVGQLLLCLARDDTFCCPYKFLKVTKFRPACVCLRVLTSLCVHKP